jgi:hypothetical protein
MANSSPKYIFKGHHCDAVIKTLSPELEADAHHGHHMTTLSFPKPELTVIPLLGV